MTARYLREHGSGCTLLVRAQPGAKKTAITGIYGDAEAVKIAIQAPPVDGRANEALIGHLAAFFAVSRSSISILHGESGRTKLLLLTGITLERAHELVSACLKAHS